MNIRNIEVLLLNEIDWNINKYTTFSLQALLFEDILTTQDNTKLNDIKRCCSDYFYYCFSGNIY